MANDLLNALSPLDGRYRRQTEALRNIFSEFGLIRYRVLVEVSWFKHLSQRADVAELPTLSAHASNYLEDLVHSFSHADAAQVKAIERTTNHDVKAVEYWVKSHLEQQAELRPHIEFVHFACTSEDINNLAYALMLREARESVLLPTLADIDGDLAGLIDNTGDVAMIARTHGQAATPTTVGKELNVFRVRLARQRTALHNVDALGKFNGAVGNFNAHVVAYPDADWMDISRSFVESLGLGWNALTTQIEPHDWIAEYLHAVVRINQIGLDLSRDAWGYIALDYFRQSKVEGETGSSTMPHKVNPIDFENAEGNFGIATALATHLAEKLPISRWQRDLSDSTALRNLGVALGHSLIAMTALRRGLGKLGVNTSKTSKELNESWELLSEAVQTVMRKHAMPEPYEQLKKLTRGKRLSASSYQKLVKQLKLPPTVEADLLLLTPATYLGLAAQLAKHGHE